MKIKRKVLSLVFLFVILLVGCERKEVEQGGKPIVYTSFYPIYTMTRNIAKDALDVRYFMPIDKDPHMWEPTPKDLKELKKADIFFVNGANMEKFLPQVKKTFSDLEIVTLSENIELITYKGQAAIGDFAYMAEFNSDPKMKYEIEFGHTHEDLMRVAFLKKNGMKEEELIKKGKKIMEQKGVLVHQKETIDVEEDKVYSIEMGHESGAIYYKLPEGGDWVFIADRVSEKILPYQILDNTGEKIDLEVHLSGSTSSLDRVTYDPHSWLSLKNAKSYYNTIFETLEKKYPDLKRKLYKNKVDAIEDLTNLEVEYKGKFKDLKNKEFVVTHYAYEYLAREFGLIQYPLQGLVSTETPSLKTIRKAIMFCNAKHINTIFYEANNETKGADTLASEIGGKTDYLTSMEYILDDSKDYVDIMRENLEKLYNSLK